MPQAAYRPRNRLQPVWHGLRSRQRHLWLLDRERRQQRYDQFICDASLTVTTPIVPTVALTITGNGHSVVLDGGNSAHLITLNSGGSLTLEQLTLQNAANSSSFGGAIQNNGGTLNIDGCSFIDDTANYGGAIGSDTGSVVTITDSTFQGNSATVNGGALTNDGTMSIAGSTFSSNSAANGGALAYISSTTVSGTTFDQNKATSGVGGAIYLFEQGGPVSSTISQSTFDHNTAATQGGAIADGSASKGPIDVTLIGDTIANNTAPAASGGGVSVTGTGGGITVGGSIVANNTGGDCANPAGRSATWATISKTKRAPARPLIVASPPAPPTMSSTRTSHPMWAASATTMVRRKPSR